MSDNDKCLPLYQTLFNLYKTQIDSGILRPGDSLPSEAQLAQLHGISNITARRVLNDLRRRGLIVRERGRGNSVTYPAQANWASGPVRRVMLIFPVDNQYTKAAECIALLFALMEKHGYYLEVHFSGDREKDECTLLTQAIAQKVEGILLYPVSSSSNTPVLLQIRQLGIPLVLLDREHVISGFCAVVTDNVDGGNKLTHYLLERGYRHIIFVTNHPLTYATSIDDRYRGYVIAHEESGLTLDTPHWFLLEDDSPDTAPLSAYIRTQQTPVALMCLSDPIAISMLQLMQSQGLLVPQDVAITGFDNLMISQQTQPPLTTMNQNFLAIAKESGLLLLHQMENTGQMHSTTTMRLPARLVTRGSTQ